MSVNVRIVQGLQEAASILASDNGAQLLGGGTLRSRSSVPMSRSLHVQPYVVAMFYVKPRKGDTLTESSPLAVQLERELFNTQILSSSSPEYKELVLSGTMSGEPFGRIRCEFSR